jgi:hypothetical protein
MSTYNLGEYISMNSVVEKLKELLQVYESAPSAHIMVKSIAGPVTDSEVDDIYNSSEGYNDSQVEAILNSMSQDQLNTVISTLKEIDQEHKDYDDEADYEEFYGEASKVLHSI